MKKIIHIVQNDKKFVNTIIRLFSNNNSVDNTFIIESNNVEEKTIKQENVFYRTTKEILADSFIKNEIKNNEILVIHSLSTSRAKLITKIDFDIKIIWAAWGGDFYHHHPSLKTKILKPKTKKIEEQLQPKIKELIIRPLIKRIYPQRFSYYWQKKAIKKIDYIAPVIYDDYELIKKHYKAPHLKCIDFSYGNLEEDLLVGVDLSLKLGENILFGNSSSFTNNHVEIIDILSRINLEDRKLITPLSYGNMKLKDYLVEYGKQKLKNNFEPLVDFIPKEEYHKIMQSCGFVIMNHKRQQGLATIITELYLGVKMFFNKENPTYNYFKKLGANVYLIDEIITKKEKAFTPLTKQEIEQNREVLIKTRSKKAVEEYIQKIAEL
jgi:hypothetical protein